MTRRAAALLTVVAAGAGAQEANWRRVATPADRERLREWRDAWKIALPAARDAGAGGLLAREGVLFDPDRSLDDALPPAGAYRCRTFKLGRSGAGRRGFSVSAAGACRVSGEGAARRFAVEEGSGRTAGALLAETAARGVFLGTALMPGEKRPMAYGRDVQRDAAGLVERVEPARWRLVLPYPRFESVLDVVEIVPAGAGEGSGA